MIASMIFFPTREFETKPQDFGMTAEDVWCKTADGIKLHGWYFDAKKEGGLNLLFFHGNAGNISIRLSQAKEWTERGISVLLLDYRGFGKSEGAIKHGDDLIKDAQAALEWLKKNKRVDISQMILFGESIGAVPAIELASRYKFKAIIIEAPFTSIKELAKKHYGMAPDFMLKDFLMDNESKIGKLQTPVFILHGTEDEVVPFEMGTRLFEKAPEPKQFLAITGAHHNDITMVGGEEFYEKPSQFILGQK